MKNKLFHLVLFLFAITNFKAEAQNTLWIQHFDHHIITVNRISPSRHGKIFVVCQFNKSFHIGKDTLNYVARDSNWFLACLESSNGTINWIKQIRGGTSLYYFGFQLNSDDDGNCYIGGLSNSQKIFFGNHEIFHDSASRNNGWFYFVKFNSSGKFIWSKTSKRVFDNIYGHFEIRNGIHRDIYLLSSISSHFDIEGKGINPFRSKRPLFLCKISENGDIIWTKQLNESSDSMSLLSFVIDNEENLYVSGIYYTNMTMGNTSFTRYQFDSRFYAKLDSTGKCIWVHEPPITTPLSFNDEFYNYIDREVYISATYLNNTGFVASVDSQGNIINMKQPGVLSYLSVGWDQFALKDGYLYAEGREGNPNNTNLNLFVYNKENYLIVNKYVPVTGTITMDPFDYQLIVCGNGVGNSTLFGMENNVPDTESFIAKIGINPAYIDSFHISDLTLYPNPVSRDGILTVHSDFGFNNPVQNTVYDMIGRKIGSFAVNPKGKTYSIPIPQLAPGIYFLEVRINADARVFKVLVD